MSEAKIVIQPFNSGTFLCESVRKRREIKNSVSDQGAVSLFRSGIREYLTG